MEINAFKQAVHGDKLLCDLFDRGNGFTHKFLGILPPERIWFWGDDGGLGVVHAYLIALAYR